MSLSARLSSQRILAPWRTYHTNGATPLLQRKNDRHKISDFSEKYSTFLILLLAVVILFGFYYIYGAGKHNEVMLAARRLGGVVANGEGCADVGVKILSIGGSAIDAAIATLLCEGVILPHSLGIGGGFIATVYVKETGKVETLIAREKAPGKASHDMFVKVDQITGAIATAVPSEIYGYWRLHLKYGKLPWKKLFEPSIDLCINGHKVTRHLANVLQLYATAIHQEPTMAEIFINPATKELYRQGDVIYRPLLGRTLQILANEGAQAIYGGGIIGKLLAEDIVNMGGIITEEDFQNYVADWEEPIVAQFTEQYTLYTTPLPSSGPVLAFILNVLGPMYTDNHPIFWQRTIETFKHAYGIRSHLGDVHFEPNVQEILNKLISLDFAAQVRHRINDDRTYKEIEYYGAIFSNEEDKGTANVAVLAPNGDAIVVTSTVNSRLGAKIRSKQTGIILNDQMDDFSTPGIINMYGIPASPANFIKPGKRPMSSMCPGLVIDNNGNIQLIIGGAGGSKITTSVAQAIIRYLFCNDTMYDAINKPRIHHQLVPMYIDIEPDVPSELIDYFAKIGHDLNYLPEGKPYSALTGIGMKSFEPVPVCDKRRIGSIATINLS